MFTVVTVQLGFRNGSFHVYACLFGVWCLARTGMIQGGVRLSWRVVSAVCLAWVDSVAVAFVFVSGVPRDDVVFVRGCLAMYRERVATTRTGMHRNQTKREK